MKKNLGQESGDLAWVDVLTSLWLCDFTISIRSSSGPQSTPRVLGSCITILSPLGPGILAPLSALLLISVP